MHIIGHRGARGLAAENTLAAIEAGIAAGVDAVEIDGRVSRDGVVVLHHDARLPGAGKPLIAALTYAEIRSHSPDVCTLDQALAAIGRRVAVRLEIKPHEPTEPIVASLKTLPDLALLEIASFDQTVLRAIHQALPDCRLVINEAWSSLRARWRARELHTTAVAMNQRWLWTGYIHAVHRGGYQLSAYTLNDPAKAKRWQRAGLAGVVTDYPDRFREER